jgi:hypothetical protein
VYTHVSLLFVILANAIFLYSFIVLLGMVKADLIKLGM